MLQPRWRDVGPALAQGAVVTLASDLAGVQAPDGRLVPPDRLGLGTVQALGAGDTICVHWLDANLDTCVPRDEVQPLGAGRHLVSVWNCDRRGRRTLRRRRLAMLDHHWEVELLPHGVIRAVRADGPCWTFHYNSLTHEVDPWCGEELTDDAAEAVVAADTATR